MIPYSEIETERIEAKKKGTDKETVPRSDFIAMLKILVRRATWGDKWRARKSHGHWLNVAKREILID